MSMIDRLKTWWNGPTPEPQPVSIPVRVVAHEPVVRVSADVPASSIECPRCKKTVVAWRTFADETSVCVPCAYRLAEKVKGN